MQRKVTCVFAHIGKHLKMYTMQISEQSVFEYSDVRRYQIILCRAKTNYVHK